jgi:UDP-glucose 4-epimerase
MRWLVTGGCGFLGANLVRHLVAEGGHGIRIFDNLAIGARSDLGPSVRFRETALAATLPIADRGVELVVGDILDRPAIARAAAGADIMVHFAANAGVARSVADPMFDCMTNVIGSLNCLEAAREHNIKRFVFASSGAPIGEAEPPIHENLPPRCFGIATVALRFGNVYGPGSGHKTSVVAAFIARAQAGLPLVVYGDGRQTRDFIYVDDLVHAVRRAAVAQGVGGEVFQIATSRETSVGELVELLVPILVRAGLSPEVEYATPRLGDVRRNFSDTSKAERMLGWRAEIELRDGLDRTVAWFLAAVKER